MMCNMKATTFLHNKSDTKKKKKCSVTVVFVGKGPAGLDETDAWQEVDNLPDFMLLHDVQFLVNGALPYVGAGHGLSI